MAVPYSTLKKLWPLTWEDKIGICLLRRARLVCCLHINWIPSPLLAKFDKEGELRSGPRADASSDRWSDWEFLCSILASKLYFLNSKDVKSLEGIKVTAKGYWEDALNDHSTLIRSPNLATITTLEFYMGQAPFGDKTDWAMHEYTINQKSSGSSSLCRVLNRSNQSRSEEQQQAVADDSNEDLQRALQLSLEPEENYVDDLQRAIELSLQHHENNHNLQDPLNNSQVLGRNEHGLSKISGSNLQNRRADNSPQHSNEPNDFLRGDFFEANDLIDLPSSSSCSENTFTASMSGDEYFDPEAFLRELDNSVIPDFNPEYIDSGALLRDPETTAVPAANQRNPDCRFNIAPPQESHQVVIQPSPSGSLCISNNQNPHTNETVVYASIRPILKGGLDPTLSAAAVEKRPDRKALKHGSAACAVNQAADPSTSQGAKVNGKKGVGRVTNRKKYSCCFFSF